MDAISREWYNGSYTIADKPIRTLELDYLMIQFLIISNYSEGNTCMFGNRYQYQYQFSNITICSNFSIVPGMFRNRFLSSFAGDERGQMPLTSAMDVVAWFVGLYMYIYSIFLFVL